MGSSNWASCQSPAPQVASERQSGGAAGVGLEGSPAHGRQRLLRCVAWQRGGSRHFLGAGERGQGGPPASWSRPSAEGVKASQHVWLLMIATPQGPGEYSREAFSLLLSVTGVRAQGPQSAPVSEWLAVCPLSVCLSVWVALGQVRAHSDAPVSFLQLEPAFVAPGHKPPSLGPDFCILPVY